MKIAKSMIELIGKTPLVQLNKVTRDCKAKISAKLEFFKIPILYLPYMTFPIDDRRKSGFLYPYISTANDNGFEFI